jgi:hypothetical protein
MSFLTVANLPLIGKTTLTVKVRGYRNVSRNRSVEFDPNSAE